MGEKKLSTLLLTTMSITLWLSNLWALPVFHERIIDTITAGGAKSVFAIDIDGDSDIDVASANADDGKINWYENVGYNSFITHTISNTATNVQSVFAADLDGDSLIDIVRTARRAGDLIRRTTAGPMCL